MDIYVVQAGDTIDTIANSYGISVDKLIEDNELTNPYRLVPGEVIVIVYPSLTYTIKEGDTLAKIAASYKISVNELLRNNPFLSDNDYIYPGEVLTISYNRTGRVATHGYTTTFINRQTLKKTLPYLTYLTIFNYRTVENGEVIGSDDDMDIIQLAKDYGVIPLLLVSTISTTGEIDLELTYKLLLSDEIQNNLFNNVLRIAKEKGYLGVNLSAQYITYENQELFDKYTKKISDLLRPEGLLSIITINPKVESIDNGVTFEKFDYSNIANAVDSILFLQYQWGINTAPPSPVISISNFDDFLDYALTQIEPQKIFSGISILGYVWELPYVPGFSRSNSITLDSVINLARDVGATIEFDEPSQTPYFIYEDLSNKDIQYIVWFINATTVNSLLKMILKKGISGTGVWNIMLYFAQLWLVINSQYEIVKLLPEF